MAGFWFTRIHILESLPPGDLRTGRVLRGALLQQIPESAGRVQYWEVENSQTLHACLSTMLAEIESEGSIPLIHFECHGDPTGLELASGEFVTWNEFRELFTPLNIACRLNLFVSLAACHGDWLTSATLLNAPAPIWAVLGPRSAQGAGALSDFFRAFFASLLVTNDLRLALSRRLVEEELAIAKFYDPA